MDSMDSLSTWIVDTYMDTVTVFTVVREKWIVWIYIVLIHGSS